MWDNCDWAARHIAKHLVTPEEAWEVLFEDSTTSPLQAFDQLRFPPYRRYWTIGKTKSGRRLMVVWDQHRGVKHLITAFEPDATRIRIYETQTKNRKSR